MIALDRIRLIAPLFLASLLLHTSIPRQVMQISPEDLFYLFADLCEKGEFLQALQTLLPHPDISYDSLPSTVPQFRYLINYADACIFLGDVEVQLARETLQNVLEADPKIQLLLEQFINILKDEQILHASYATDPEMTKFKDIPSFYQPLCRQKFNFFQNYHAFIRLKPPLTPLMTGLMESHGCPWHQFSYPLPLENVAPAAESTPLIFLEPLQGVDYKKFLLPFQGRGVIFVIETVSIFFQLLHFNDLVTELGNTRALIFILEIYPDEQFQVQDFKEIRTTTLQPILTVERPALREALPLFTNILQKYLSQAQEREKHETPLSNWLYQATQRLLFRIQSERYGPSRCLALSVKIGRQHWHDPHKGLPPSHADLGPLPKDYVAQLIQAAAQKRHKRKLKNKPKIRLAHVAPQIVDGGHAPSKLVKTLLEFSDRSYFDRFLIITEQLANYPLEYPIAPYRSESSKIRGIETLKHLQHADVHIWIENPSESYEQTAHNLAQKISALEFDLVIFHGPDVINNLCSASINTPVRVMFEHGTLPSYPCFDFVIVSSEDAFQRNQQELQELGMESAPLHFSVDVRKAWKPKPYTKQELGFPSDSFIMTTISHHLDARLSLDMCHAIGQILQRSPKAFYAPIGPVTQEKKFRAVFEIYNVNDRVIFLGRRENPSQYARSMELYLNEFPFGSCIGILDAMAAGCPIVSMYDEEGPQQSRYGGNYFGIDRVLTNGKNSDYVELACSLISNHELYNKWSEHALKQFEKHVNEKAYVKNFERILKQLMTNY